MDCDPNLTDSELRNKERIQYDINRNGFRVNRLLFHYQEQLDKVEDEDTFSKRLFELKPEDHWLEVGGGIHMAMMNFIGITVDQTGELILPVRKKRNFFPRLTNLIVSDSFDSSMTSPTEQRMLALYKSFRAQTGDFWIKNLVGHKIEDYANLIELLGGPVQLLSDVKAATAYTDRLSDVIETYLKVTNTGGAIFIDGENFVRTSIIDKDGTPISMKRFFKAIQGAQVHYVDHRKDPSRYNPRTVRLIRNGDPIYVPQLGIAKPSDTGLPPVWTYQTPWSPAAE